MRLIVVVGLVVGTLAGCVSDPERTETLRERPHPGEWFLYEEVGTGVTYHVEFLLEDLCLTSEGRLVPSIPIRYTRTGSEGPSKGLERLDALSHRRFAAWTECLREDEGCTVGRREVAFKTAEGHGFLGWSPLWAHTPARPGDELETNPSPSSGLECTSYSRPHAATRSTLTGFPIFDEPVVTRACPGDRAPREVEGPRRSFRLISSGTAEPAMAPPAPNVEAFSAGRSRLEWSAWDRRTPPLGAAFERFPHDEAVRWLEAHDRSYIAFMEDHEDAFVRLSFHFETGGGKSLIGEQTSFERNLEFQAPEGDAYAVTLVKTFTTLGGAPAPAIISKRDEQSEPRPVFYDPVRGELKVVTFGSAERWSRSLMNDEAIHSVMRIGSEGPSTGPSYRFNYDPLDAPSDSSITLTFPESVFVDGTTGKLERLIVSASRWS